MATSGLTEHLNGEKIREMAAVIYPAAGIGADYASESYCIFRNKGGFPRMIQLGIILSFPR